MTRNLVAGLSVLILLAAPPVLAGGGGAAPAWSALPLLLPAPQRGGGRGEASLCAVNTVAGEGRLYAPQTANGIGFESFPAREGCLRVKSGVGNYHWLATRENRPGEVIVAATAVYFSNPGPAPREMLATPKSELEIVPVALPREHAQFQAGEAWSFQVRFQGQPLAGAAVRYEDSLGQSQEWTSDARGAVRVVFPPWREEAHAGHDGGHGRSPERGFVVAVEHRAGGARYLSAFNHVYGPHDLWRKSVPAGVGFVVLGMALAVPLFKRRSAG